jgi:hypothetical protein
VIEISFAYSKDKTRSSKKKEEYLKEGVNTLPLQKVNLFCSRQLK